MIRIFLRTFACATLAAALAAPVAAQTDPHAGHALPDSTSAAPPQADGHDGHGGAPTDHAAPPSAHRHPPSHGSHGAMTRAVAPAAPMTADASGTARIPTTTPVDAAHAAAGRWHLMLHGAAFPRVTAQDVLGSGSRGGTSVGAPNWLMGMAQRPAGPATLTLRAMVSLDPLTESGDGYRLLFQSGETFGGARLVDRQHPHDGLSELSATVAARVAPGVAAFGYVGYPGEPALGPAAFMHRPSARFAPAAPLSHHWQDATHITWGVATGGVAAGPLTVDGSLFSAAEADERRWTPDRPRFDSYSARVAVSPTPHWAVQVSRGFLREPEALEPGVDQVRTTASVLFGAPVRGGDVSASVVWGRNRLSEDGGGHAEAGHAEAGHGGPQQAFLAEAALRRGRVAVFGRGEWVEKSGEELDLGGALGEGVYGVGALGLGAGVDVARRGGLVAMLGADVTAYRVPGALRALYGRAPVSAQVFLRITPVGL